MAKVIFGSLIGSGGFGEVFRASIDGKTDEFAVKRLKVGVDAQALGRFRREVRVQMKLRHKNVVPIVGSNLNVSQPMFLMPLAQGSLRERLASTCGEDELWIWKDIANGISHAHKNGVIHRDIKPENVLFLPDRSGIRAAIADFGLGRMLDRDSTTITITNMGMGTIAYMAPEQMTDAKSVDERADIFALGKLLAEILSGKFPYPVIDYSAVPPKYAYIIRKATNHDPAQRYESVQQLIDQVEMIGSSFLGGSAADSIQAELKRLAGLPSLNASETEPVAKLLAENFDDSALLIKVLPGIQSDVMRAVLRFHASTMEHVLSAYDQEISGSLPFEYCDKAADFYKEMFQEDGPMDVNLRILKRLPQMGASHNRWYVGRVFGEILQSISSQGMIAAAVGVIQDIEPSHLRWVLDYVNLSLVPVAIKRALSNHAASVGE